MLTQAGRRLSCSQLQGLTHFTCLLHEGSDWQATQSALSPEPNAQQYRWASKKQGGSTQNGKDSNPKMLGVKLFGGQQCVPGNIIIRQRGTQFHPGTNVGLGKDHTIYATAAGKVKFNYHKLTKRRIVGVE
ncbi:hypothetical protein WJX74_007055 [Apatococcus lobatus]|uniref:Ribosomal protein L27 n=2 Tax=Apatococcus TaxID=904362 RepID=A0AAW1SUY7_9CHLO